MHWHHIQQKAPFYLYSFDRDGSSESYGRYVKVPVSSFVLPPHCHHITRTELQQRKGINCTPDKHAGFRSKTGSCSIHCPHLIAQSPYSVPVDPGFLNNWYIDLPCSKFLTKKYCYSFAMVQISLDKFTALRSGPIRGEVLCPGRTKPLVLF